MRAQRPKSNQQQNEARSRRTGHSQQTGAARTDLSTKDASVRPGLPLSCSSLVEHQRAKAIHTTLTLHKSHAQFPVGTCRKRPPGDSQTGPPLRKGGFDLNATSVVSDSVARSYQLSLSLLTASFLVAAVRCHDALPEANLGLQNYRDQKAK
jgi:hypothetical protein